MPVGRGDGVKSVGRGGGKIGRQSEAVTVSLFFSPAVTSTTPTHGHFVLPSFVRIKRPRWRPVGLNDRHLRSNGKIGDCEQSISDYVNQ